MAEYLRRDDVLSNADIITVQTREYGTIDVVPVEYLADLPTADVVEVKRGEWSHLGGDEWCCTNCGEVITTEGSWDKPTKKYCNECGAKMDGRSN